MTPPKVIVVGLDSVPPELVFGQYRDEMPVLSSMVRRGMGVSLQSTHPPVTVPAWVSMTSGLRPEHLGVYGFGRFAMDGLKTVVTRAGDVEAPRIWQYLEKERRRSVVVSVPLTYGMAMSPWTTMTTGFLTPAETSRYASGPRLQRELSHRFGNYRVDVSDFRHKSPATVLGECLELTRQHFDIFHHLIETRHPELAMMVDMGPDRLHHAALRHIDRRHPAFVSDEMGRQYYRELDRQLERAMGLAGPDTLCMVVSDHGVKPLLGAVCINEYLIHKGYLHLKAAYPKAPTKLTDAMVDWTRSRAVAFGGYHAKVYLNIKGRQPQGIVDAASVPELQDAVVADLEQMPGVPNVKAQTAIQLYGDYVGTPPDLTIYFDNLNYRAAGTIGHNALQIAANDTGFDDANHQPMGILVASGPGVPQGSEKSRHICDICPTALTALGIAAPATLDGKSFLV